VCAWTGSINGALFNGKGIHNGKVSAPKKKEIQRFPHVFTFENFSKQL
jgi:hypothetical protein